MHQLACTVNVRLEGSYKSNNVPVERLWIIVDSSKANQQKLAACKCILRKAEASLQPGKSPDPSASPTNTHRSYPPP
jgi:hypothetical protein